MDFKSKFIVLAAAIVGTSMVYIESVADNVALPAIQAEFNARLSDLQWIDQMYALCLVALLLVGGSLGDRYGRKRVFVIGVISFVIASALGGLTQNVGQLIGVRALQGLSAAVLVPGSLAMISDHYEGQERGAAIGTWWAFATVMLAVGLVLGGLLVQNVTWRAIFFINIPLGLVALALSTQIPSTPLAHAPRHTDWSGALLVSFGLGGIIYALIEGSNRGPTDPLVVLAFLGGVGFLAAFIFIEARSENAIMPLALFRSRSFSMTNLLLLLICGTLTSLLFLMPLNFIQVQGYPAGQASLAIMPVILALFVLSRPAGSLAARIGTRTLVVAATLVSAAGFVLLSRAGIGESYWLTFFPGLALIGVGMAFSMTPLTALGITSVESRYAGVASGVLNAAARVGNLLVVTILVALIGWLFARSLGARLAPLQLAPQVEHAVLEQRNRLAGAQVPAEPDEATRAKIELAIDESFITGFQTAMLVSAGILVASSLGALFKIGRLEEEQTRANVGGVTSSSKAAV